MVGSTSMTAPGAVAESFSANIPDIIRETIGEKLRHEEIGALSRARDDALRSMIPHESEPFRLFLQQQQLYQDRCGELLRRVRPQLHKAIDDVIDEIEHELGNISGLVRRTALQTPRSALHGIVLGASGMDEYTLSQPKAPVANMEPPALGIRSPSRSVTPPAVQLPTTSNVTSREPASSFTEAGSPVTPTAKPSTKRPLDDVQRMTESNKRSKNLAQSGGDRPRPRKELRMNQVNEDECIFQYQDYDGFYVLRCCLQKHKIGNKNFYFRAHPFLYKRAISHFNKRGHGKAKAEDEIFDTYAYKVIDAKEERNLNKPASTVLAAQPHGTAQLTPRGLLGSENKGKQPVYTAAALSLRSPVTPTVYPPERLKQTGMDTTSRYATSRGGASNDPDADVYVLDDYQHERPSTRKLVDRNTRAKNPVYLDKPLADDEFQR
ncbi:hypothetical protein BJ170DRAFT_421065 [Xylariales sp. AK1849]|nr:hypothetical protein BJ170DRAFT_421065 [Xylariales sp. AK1849]